MRLTGPTRTQPSCTQRDKNIKAARVGVGVGAAGVCIGSMRVFRFDTNILVFPT